MFNFSKNTPLCCAKTRQPCQKVVFSLQTQSTCREIVFVYFSYAAPPNSISKPSDFAAPFSAESSCIFLSPGNFKQPANGTFVLSGIHVWRKFVFSFRSPLSHFLFYVTKEGFCPSVRPSVRPSVHPSVRRALFNNNNNNNNGHLSRLSQESPGRLQYK